MRRRALSAALLLGLPSPLAAQDVEPVTPASVVAAASAAEWVRIAPEDLLVMELAPDGRGRARQVVIQLIPAPFSQPWVANVRTLANAHWWDGTSVYRVVDNWVAQWGAGEDGGEAGFEPHPLPEGVMSPVGRYDLPRAQTVLAELGNHEFGSYKRSWWRWHTPNPTQEPYSEEQGFLDGFPYAINSQFIWPIHCYASVGVARDLAPDTGTGAELYAVIGHAPRQLDRNIAIIGRVISGIEHLSTLPRGSGEAGVYESRAEDTPIISVRPGSELPEPPHFEYLSTDSASFARYVASRANRNDAFYTVPAGGVDICNVQVPIRPVEL